jgi:hypothetical protein
MADLAADMSVTRAGFPNMAVTGERRPLIYLPAHQKRQATD